MTKTLRGSSPFNWLLKRFKGWPFFFLALAMGILLLITQNEFVDYDDRQVLFGNHDILTFNLKALWSEFEHGVTPLTYTTFAIENWLLGMQPWHFHLINGFIHLFNSILVGSLIFQLNRSATLAWIFAILFLIHPMNVETYAWANQRKHLLATFFYLSSLLTWIQYSSVPSDDKRKKNYLLAGTYLFFILGFCSKIMAVTLPAALLVYEKIYGSSFKKSLMKIGPLFFLPLPLLYHEVLVQKRPLSSETPSFLTLPDDLLEKFSFYISRVVTPHEMRVFYGDTELGMMGFLVAVFLLVFLFWRTMRSATEKQVIVFGWVIFFINILPAVKIIPFGVDSKWNDRYIYLPMVGIMLAIAAPLADIDWTAKVTLKRLRLLTTLLFVTIFSFQTFHQIKVWSSSDHLWLNVLKFEPDSFTAHKNLAPVKIARGLYQEGIDHLTRALQKNPRDKDLYINLAIAYNLTGHLEESGKIYSFLISKNAQDGVILTNYGNHLIKIGQLKEAEKILTAALQYKDVPPQAHLNLGFVYVGLHQPEAAKHSLEKFLFLTRGTPPDPEAVRILTLLNAQQ